MKHQGLMRLGAVVLTLMALTATTMVPAAEAGHGNGRGHSKYRADYGDYGRHGSYRGRVVAGYPTRVEYRRSSSSSSAGPLIAGLIGGFALGTALSNHDHYVVHERVYDRGYGGRGGYGGGYRNRDCDDYGSSRGYRSASYVYVDPYCGDRYASFDACSAHFRGCEHPRVIQKIAVSSGRCVDTYRYRDGGWRECDEEDWD